MALFLGATNQGYFLIFFLLKKWTWGRQTRAIFFFSLIFLLLEPLSFSQGREKRKRKKNPYSFSFFSWPELFIGNTTRAFCFMGWEG